MTIEGLGEFVPDKSRLLITKKVGEATDEQGNVFIMKQNVDGALVVESKNTGRTFMLGWRDAIRLAISEGILDDPAAS